MKSVYSLDRAARNGFTQEEIEILCILQTHLDNLHKNLFVLASKNRHNKNSVVQDLLTRREMEIADLLCRGLTPIKISGRLCISPPTTYRHIANLHMKLNVSNRQELLLKLMELQASGDKRE
jgi:DNA-binding CsgD family transcriptional regulator